MAVGDFEGDDFEGDPDLGDIDPDQVADDVDAAARRIEARYLLAFAWLRAQQTDAELELAVEAGAIEAIAPGLARTTAAVAGEVEGAYVDAGSATAEHIGSPEPFTGSTPEAEAAITATETRVADALEAEQRQVIADVVAEGKRRGRSNRATAARVRASLGLSPAQIAASEAYERALRALDASALDRTARDRRFDATVRKAIETGTPLTEEQIARMVERYRAKALRARAKAIAVLEAQRAIHGGIFDAIAAAVRGGDIEAGLVSAVWKTRKDPIVRDSHVHMEGQVQAYGDPFLSGAGNLLAYPGDPAAPLSDTIHCRCRLGLRFKPRAAAVGAARAAAKRRIWIVHAAAA